MDPLSVTVSVIAIIGAITTTGKGIASLRQIRDAPKELARLLSEIDELHDVLQQIYSVVDGLRLESAGQEDIHTYRTIEWIKEQVEKADEAVLELDRLGQICSKTSDTGQTECSRRRWQQNRTRAKTLLSDVQSIRGKLMSSLAIINLSSTIRLESSTREVVFNQQQATQILSTLVGQMTAQTSPIRETLSGTQGVTEDYNGEQLENGALTAQPLIQPANMRIIASDVEAEQPETLKPSTTGLSYDFHFAKDGLPADKGKKCSLWCSCVCHSRKVFLVPSPFGTLSGSFSGLPLLTRRCTEHSCKNREGPSVNIVYRFPSWFWSRLIAVTMKSIPICGPEINVRFPREVMPSKLYLRAMHGDTQGVKSLFTEGLASPWDVNGNGSSVLYFAAISGDVGLCRFLIEQGADPLLENRYHTSPVSLAWERILSNEVKPDKAAKFAMSFGRIDYINTLQFKPLHKAVLALAPLPLEPLLDCSTSDINIQDREGRTSLLWATTRDDIESLRLLLEYGADVNKSDNRGFSPIHSAKSLPSLKLLLDHDAEIMSKTEVGATPLHFASRYGRHDMIEPMVQAHADPNASDADDTPLICSTYDHQPGSTETLLRLGANPDLAAKKSGITALYFAVTDNQHEIIRQLLSHGADCTLEAEKGRNIVHLAAIHGGELTMDILSRARLTGIDLEARDSLGKTARDYFEERSEGDAPNAVKDAFTVLLHSISAARGSRTDDGTFPEVFYDAVEEF